MLRLGVGVGCVGGTVVEIAQKRKKQKSTCLCSVETNQNLIYKGAQTEERSLLEKRRGKKGRRELGRQRVEKMMIVVLSPLYRTDCFFSNHWCDPRLLFFCFFFLRWMLQEMLALRPAPPSATHLHSLTHTYTQLTYICRYIYLSICRGGRTSCNARVSKASIVSTYQTANAMHTLLHHVKRALFFFSFFVLFRRIVPTTTWMGERKQGTPQETNSREYIESSHQQVFCRIFFLILIRIN